MEQLLTLIERLTRRALVLAGLMAALVCTAGCGAGARRADAPAAPRPGAAFREPPTLRSHDGVLRATLTVRRRRVWVAGARVWAKVYDGSFPGPTLRVRPGDTL